MAKKYVLNSLGENAIIHYTHQNVSPFTINLERSVVSIHDNPFTALKYGIYNTPGGAISDKVSFQLYSQSVKHNLAQYKKFRYVVTTSDYVKKSLIRYGYRNEITTIHPPIGQSFFPIADKRRLRRELNLPIEKILLLSVSTDQPRKNLKLIENLMNSLGQNYRVIRVGKPILNSINYSNVDPITLNKIYNACDLLVIPSTEEGYGSPIPEAMAVGTPVVCSNIEVFHELCLNAAAYFDPNSVEDLEMAIKTVNENHEEYSELALKRSEEFTYSKFCTKINSYYNQRFFK
jgi:glycosyltransferase involved in cell wall biosynthesis